MTTFKTMFGFSFASAGLLLACGANPGPAVVGTSDPPTTNQKNADAVVVDRLSVARCDQEQGCKNIGPDAKFASMSVCTDQMRGSIGNDLNAYNCPHGLDSDGVERCTAAIKGEECSHPFDTLKRYDKCRTGAICMK